MRILKWTAMGMRDEGIGEYVELRELELLAARLAASRLHAATLEARIATLRATLCDVSSGEVSINISVREARKAIAADDEAAKAGAERAT